LARLPERAQRRGLGWVPAGPGVEAPAQGAALRDGPSKVPATSGAGSTSSPGQLAKTSSRIGPLMHEIKGRCAGLPMDVYQPAEVAPQRS